MYIDVKIIPRLVKFRALSTSKVEVQPDLKNPNWVTQKKDVGFEIQTILLMLVTDVGDEMCW